MALILDLLLCFESLASSLGIGSFKNVSLDNCQLNGGEVVPNAVFGRQTT